MGVFFRRVLSNAQNPIPPISQKKAEPFLIQLFGHFGDK